MIAAGMEIHEPSANAKLSELYLMAYMEQGYAPLACVFSSVQLSLDCRDPEHGPLCHDLLVTANTEIKIA